MNGRKVESTDEKVLQYARDILDKKVEWDQEQMARYRRGPAKLKSQVTRARIRADACQRMNGIPKKCACCGYEKFVEVCHIKPVTEFPKTASLDEINDMLNMIYLCPNCHWEFDHTNRAEWLLKRG